MKKVLRVTSEIKLPFILPVDNVSYVIPHIAIGKYPIAKVYGRTAITPDTENPKRTSFTIESLLELYPDNCEVIELPETDEEIFKTAFESQVYWELNINPLNIPNDWHIVEHGQMIKFAEKYHKLKQELEK
ncbi:MAG: hypothetical protein GY853_14440 [PVC group bacterium]|nr:hypothetical protein [PVC group bacterium]